MNMVERNAGQLEQILNPIDWIPFFSSYTGMVRILAGMVQMVASPIFIYVQSINLLLKTTKGYITPALKEGGFYALHGIANIIRGSIAMLPGINLLLLAYDRKLGLRFNYPNENVQSRVYPMVSTKRLA